MYVKPLAITAVTLTLNACGGGGSSPAPSPPPPAVAVAKITGVVPAAAMVGIETTFEVAGLDLPSGMSFALPGCTGTVEKAGGGPTKRQFTCTPAGPLVAYKGKVAAGTGTPFEFSVNYQGPILHASASDGRMLVVAADGTLYSWGYTPGDGTSTVALVPKKIGTDFVSAVAGESSALAIKKDGSLWSWGYGAILGTATSANMLTPTQIGSDFVDVTIEWKGTSSGEHAIGLKRDGSLWVWGQRGLPTGQYGHQSTPRMFATGFRGLGANDSALKADGSVWEWTINKAVVSAGDTPDSSFTPRQVGAGYVAVAGGFSVTYGLKADGSLWNWGAYAKREGAGSNDETTHFPLSSGVRAIATGLGGAMIIKADNTLWPAVGDKPVQAGEYIAVWPDRTCTMAMKTDGTLWAWGLCLFGDGQFSRYTQPNNTPVQIVLPK